MINKWEALELNNGSLMYNPVVVLNDTEEVVATGMILLEEKLIHECGIVGHIEDIAVRHDQQGKQLGKILIQHLTEIGEKGGCYKVILDCDVKNKGFYEKCGYKEAGLEMQVRL
jgi:glucosamine-phosphate N-acetyltransferase